MNDDPLVCHIADIGAFHGFVRDREEPIRWRDIEKPRTDVADIWEEDEE